MKPTQFEQHVTASLDRSVETFNAGLAEFFEDFADDATIFTADSPEPIKGREMYRQRYSSAFSGQTRLKTILDRNVQIIGEKAVVTQTARITQADASADVRQTIIYGDTAHGPKVLHLHTALLAPKAEGHGAGKSSIRVVNERIAPVAQQPGVAQ